MSILRRLLRPLLDALILLGQAWFALPPAQAPEEPVPVEPTTGPGPLHPERVRPDVAPTGAELELFAQVQAVFERW